MCTTAVGLEALGTLVQVGGNVSKKINENATSEYKEQIALNNARLLEEEANYQKQLGIEEARAEKIKGLQEANYQKAINSASNIDSFSGTSAFNFEDIVANYENNAQNIMNNQNRQGLEYIKRANSYLQEANELRKQRKNNLFNFKMQGLGSSSKINKNWLSKI